MRKRLVFYVAFCFIGFNLFVKRVSAEVVTIYDSLGSACNSGDMD